MSSAKPGKSDEIGDGTKSQEDHPSKRQKTTLDANPTDVRSQNWAPYNDTQVHYGQPDASRQTGNNNPDGTYPRDKAQPYADPLMMYAGLLPPNIDPRILITGTTNNQLNMATSSSFQIQNNTPTSMAYPVAMEPYSSYAFPVVIDQRFNPSRGNEQIRSEGPGAMPSPFHGNLPPNNNPGTFPPPYLPKGAEVDPRNSSDIFAPIRNKLRNEYIARANLEQGNSDTGNSERPDSANTNSSNPESGNDLEDDDDEPTGKRRPILKTNEDRRVHHKLVEQERRKTMNKYINRLRELMDIPAPTKGRGLKKSIVLEKACEYVDKIHEYCATLYNANQQLMNALNMRGATPQMMAQLNIPFVPPPPSHIYPPSNYRAPQYANTSPNQRPDPHSRVPLQYQTYFKPDVVENQPFPQHIDNPLNNTANTTQFNPNINTQPNTNNFHPHGGGSINNSHNTHGSFSDKHTEP